MRRLLMIRDCIGWLGFVAISVASPSGRAEPNGRPDPIYSLGPKLLLQSRVDKTPPADMPSVAERLSLRHNGLRRAERWGIAVDEDLRNYLTGFGGTEGAIARTRRLAGNRPTTPPMGHTTAKINQAAVHARAALNEAVRSHGLEGARLEAFNKMMLWRTLAYNSSTLAHGSFGSGQGANPDLARAASRGLRDAIDLAANLSDRLTQSVAANDGSSFLKMKDLIQLHDATVSQLPRDQNVGQLGIRDTSFASGFGVAARRGNNKNLWHDSKRHGRESMLEWRVRRAEELVARWTRKANWGKVVIDNPLLLLAAGEYFIHNVHPMRDGNGRTESLATMPLARAAGFSVPLEFDQLSGGFRLAAQKWGGRRVDLYEFLLSSVGATTRFVNTVAPVIGKAKILSTHTDRGAVVSVLDEGNGERSLLVMAPITHAHTPDGDVAMAAARDPELRELVERDRLVTAGPSFDPKSVSIEVAVNGRHNTWQPVQTAAVYKRNTRYHWWTTTEPIFKMKLPKDANFVNFRVVGAGGTLHTGDYYVDLREAERS